MRVLLLGAGKIGTAVAELLCGSGDYILTVADRDPTTSICSKHEIVTFAEADITQSEKLLQLMQGHEVVVSALPYSLNVRVAEAARAASIHYFDLTEDVDTRRQIERIAQGAGEVFMPQCGLAPGFISVATFHLADKFDSLKSIHMRVGALPQYPTNRLNYNLTWSTDGLINEYCNPCEAIYEGRRIEALPLEGLERFSLDGVTYEAFNTSGGLGTLCDTLGDRVEELNYKTVRYPGHCEQIKLLCIDLELGKRRGLFKNVLESSIPATMQDVVMIFTSVTGILENRLIQESYIKKIYSREINGVTWSAIQVTTAAGVCAMVDLLREGKLKKRGFVRQEDVALGTFLKNRFGQYFA